MPSAVCGRFRLLCAYLISACVGLAGVVGCRVEVMNRIILSILVCLCWSSISWGLKPEELAVVYNADSELSVRTMQRYCELRNIPEENRFPLYSVARGDISRSDFDMKIRKDLMIQALQKGLRWPASRHGGARTLRAILLMPDIPLKVAHNTELDGKKSYRNNNGASVDNELQLLGTKYPLLSWLQNPLYGKKARLKDIKDPILAVCRIDGPDEECIRRMVEDPVQVEKTGLWGWTVVDRGGPYKHGEHMFDRAAALAKQNHLALFFETSAKTLADSFPMMPQTAVYYGWYGYPANGPFQPGAPADFKFAPGAIAGHLHSFSSPSIHDKKMWVPALLSRGAAVSAGNVDEPFLAGCIDFGVFHERLMAGYTVAEAALVATPTLSWQGIVMGDPLYTPFSPKARASSRNPFVIWTKLCRKAGANDLMLQQEVDKLAGSSDAALFAELYAFHCAEIDQMPRAAEYFQKAHEGYSELRDKTRTMILLATVLAADGQRSHALDRAQSWLYATAGSPYEKALRATIDAISGKAK